MLSSLLKSFSGDDEEHKKLATQVNLYADRLKKITDLYPIGAKVNYYPEFLTDIVFETIILGYEINNRPVYSRDHVRERNQGLEFFIESTSATVPAIDVGSFTFIVPDTSDTTKKLDYDSIAKIGRGGQFMRGNDISLVGSGTNEGIPILDTTVVRKTRVREGYYQNYEVVILDPKFDSLTTKENRQQSRLQFSLPCTLNSAAGNGSVLNCTMIDCSELCIGIQVNDPSNESAIFTEGSTVELSIPIPMLDRSFELIGEVLAVRPNQKLVIELQEINKQGAFEELELVDRLDLRAALLHSSGDRRTPAIGDERPLLP